MLRVDGYTGFRVPSWFSKLTLQNLRKTNLDAWRNWARISPIELLPSLTLSLRNINAEIQANDETVVMFPALLELHLDDADLSF